ncbi:sialidase family protein [Prosthecobacter sp.]|uniref:sialidase family protein n=1 Tax=Prosthecobacter sp. TaxID=1965333 RepID=UPI003783212F
MMKHLLPRAFWGLFLFDVIAITVAGAADPPRMLFLEDAGHDATAPSGTRSGYAILRREDGSFCFYNPYTPRAEPLRLPDGKGERYTLLPALPESLAKSKALVTSGILNNAQTLLAADGTVRSLTVKSERLSKEDAARIGLPMYLDMWYQQGNVDAVGAPVRTWRGYNGSQMEYQRLASGRLLVPHGSFLPHSKAAPPTGRHETVIEYSDDGGATWQLSASRLTSPCYDGFNGANEGACEPCFEERRDGSIWMLMRTQAGCLYESFSKDGGSTWSVAAPSRFRTSTGPANLLRHRDGRLVLTWNNCELPPKHDGVGVYGGRDALHIAISDDDGRTWQGFREIYLDHRRNDNPAASGDRGTAYPLAAFDEQGRIIVLAGQGKGGRNPIVVDPAWITETAAESDFSDGLAQWSTYQHIGPAKRWWRARRTGCELIETPDEKGSRSLHVRHAASTEAPSEPDTAVWNFPNGWRGELTARIRLPGGSQGAIFSLNDRFFDPSNTLGEDAAVFQAKVTTGEAKPDEWHTLSMRWDLARGQCEYRLDDAPVSTLPLHSRTLNGVSYLRIRAAAATPDAQGVIIRHVKAHIDDPNAPVVTREDVDAWQQEYVKSIVPRW